VLGLGHLDSVESLARAVGEVLAEDRLLLGLGQLALGLHLLGLAFLGALLEFFALLFAKLFEFVVAWLATHVFL
jgi:hypothetical protein